jgi:flagellar biosynthetic protein FlhB
MSGGAEDGAERSHDPTPKKLEDARRKGEIVKSQEVGVAAGYLGALLALVLVAPGIGARMLALGGTLLQDAEALAAPLAHGGAGRGGDVLWATLAIAGLAVLPAAALVLVALAAQRAFVFAPTKLAPKLSRVSPLAQAKQKFGPSGLFEFAKSAAKLVIISALLAWFLARDTDGLIASAMLDPRQVPGALADVTTRFTVAVVLVTMALAAVDYAWQRHDHMAKNRMTRQEVLDETKQSEGDPQLKARRRQRAQELAANRMLGDVPEAAVVVVNPTHYAVALRWSPTDPTPPVVVAKGVDEIAARIREVAGEAGVPIYSDPPTARALHATTEVGAAIDREHFVAVAAAIRFARELAEMAGARR